MGPSGRGGRGRGRAVSTPKAGGKAPSGPSTQDAPQKPGLASHLAPSSPLVPSCQLSEAFLLQEGDCPQTWEVTPFDHNSEN